MPGGVAVTGWRSVVLRDVGRDFPTAGFAHPAGYGGAEHAPRNPASAPGGRLTFLLRQDSQQRRRPATPGRPSADCPALLAAGSRRGTRPAGSDSRAGLPRPLLRCSAGSERAFRRHRASTETESGTGRRSPAFLLPSDVPTGGWDGREKGFACLSPQGEFAKTPPGAPGRREPPKGARQRGTFLCILSCRATRKDVARRGRVSGQRYAKHGENVP